MTEKQMRDMPNLDYHKLTEEQKDGLVAEISKLDGDMKLSRQALDGMVGDKPFDVEENPNTFAARFIQGAYHADAGLTATKHSGAYLLGYAYGENQVNS